MIVADTWNGWYYSSADVTVTTAAFLSWAGPGQRPPNTPFVDSKHDGAC